MVSSSADSTIRVWNYSGRCQSVLEGHIGVVRCLCLRGERLVSGGDRKRVVIWDVKVCPVPNQTVYRAVLYMTLYIYIPYI